MIYYGNQGARKVTISDPLIALQSTVGSYTAYGQTSNAGDIFGHSTTTTYDGNSLYPTQTVVAVSPSANLTTNWTYNSVGQLILATRMNGAQSIAEQLWLDSWGRMVRDVRNCVTAVAPPSLCTGTSDAATNVVTRNAYDLNGNLTDTYTQSAVSGAWIVTHQFFDANGNRVGIVQNCVTITNPCDGSTAADKNVVTAFAYDAQNMLVDTYLPWPGCKTACVPLPTCTSTPVACSLQTAPCPSSSCVDDRTIYDLAGRPALQIANYGGTQDVSQANVTTQVAYDGDDRVTDIYTPITSSTLQTGQISEHRSYDVLGRLISDIKANSIPVWMTATTQSRWDYTVDAGGRVISVSGPGTGSTSQTNRIATNTDYDALGRALYVTVDPGTSPHLNATTRMAYDPRNGTGNGDHVWTPPTQQQVSAGLETTTKYDFAGHPIAVISDDGAGGLQSLTATTYDGYGRATDVTDPRGIISHLTYDALDRPASTTLNYCPSGNSNPNCTGSSVLPDQNLSTSYVYDLAGNRIESINPRGIISYATYDAAGRAILTTRSCQTVPTPPATSCGTQSFDQNVTNSQIYDQLGHVLSTTEPLGRINVFAYDALGRKVSETDNCVTTSSPCDAGVTSGQNLTTSWQLDAQGDILKQTSARQCTSGAPCYQGYNGTSITDGANLLTTYTYDGRLRLLSVAEDSGHLNQVTNYTYDPSGSKLSQTDGLGSGHSTTYTIDNLGRVASVTDAGSNVVQTNYSLAGEILSTVNARGKTNASTLDRLGRLAGLSYYKADGTTPLTRTFAYDSDGNLTSFSDTDVGQTTVTYDHLNRPGTVTAPSPLGTTTYTYFLDGAVNTVVDATGTSTFTEDRLGQVATMADPLTAGTTSYALDAAGRLVGRTEANGIVTTVTYSGMDQMESKTEVAGSTTLASWTSVTYDLDQNRTGETLTYYAGNPYPDSYAGTATYKYDTIDQFSQANIPGVTAATYGYDAAHNLTANAGTSQAYNSNESLQTVGATTIGADADGNQQKDVNGNTLSWNSLSQLEKFSTTETYAYDALGRLTTVSNGGGITTQFVYRGLTGQVIRELNGAGSVIRSYAWDTSGHQLYVKIGSNSYYEILNPHGDVAALASASALVGTAHFDGWGNAFTPGGTTIPFGFQGSFGSWTDSTTGLVNMGVRWYYPKVGRFLSSDPAVGTADPRTPIEGLRWIYADNDPLDQIDPTGLKTMLDTSGGCNKACQDKNAADAKAAKERAKKQTKVCSRFGCTTTSSNGPDMCNLGGVHWCAGANALGSGVKSIRFDAAQLNQDNIRDSLVGMLDEGASAVVETGCLAAGSVPCQLLNVQSRTNNLVSDGIKAMGGTVNTNSDAYRDGRISFEIGSVAAGGYGALRAAPSVIRAVAALRGGAPEAAFTSGVPNANAVAGYFRPSGYRQGVRAAVWDAARESSTGQVRDPLTGQFMSPSKAWHMGHRPGYEFRKAQVSAAERGISRQQWLDEYNDPYVYRPELPGSNTSHRGEDMSDAYYGP